MFSSRTVLAAIGVLSLGALRAVAQTDAQREQFYACTRSIALQTPIETVYWEYNDGSVFDATYIYDPQYCNASIPVNFIRLNDYVTGDVYTCSRQQFASTRSTIYTSCVLTR